MGWHCEECGHYEEKLEGGKCYKCRNYCRICTSLFDVENGSCGNCNNPDIKICRKCRKFNYPLAESCGNCQYSFRFQCMLGSDGEIPLNYLNFVIDRERELGRYIIENNLNCPYNTFKQLVDNPNDKKILDDLENNM